MTHPSAIAHDRWFLDGICTHIITFEGDSQAKMYLGNWSDYEAMMKEKHGKDLTPHRMKDRLLKRYACKVQPGFNECK